MIFLTLCGRTIHTPSLLHSPPLFHLCFPPCRLCTGCASFEMQLLSRLYVKGCTRECQCDAVSLMRLTTAGKIAIFTVIIIIFEKNQLTGPSYRINPSQNDLVMTV